MSVVPPDLAKGCRSAQVIGGVMILAVVTYAVVVEIVRSVHAPFRGFAPGVALDTLRVVLVVLAAVELATIRFIRPKLLAAPARAVQPSLTSRLLTASLVTLAMCMAVAVYGLVLFLVGGRPLDFYGFAVFSLLAMAVHFPRRSQWEEWARDQARPG